MLKQKDIIVSYINQNIPRGFFVCPPVNESPDIIYHRLEEALEEVMGQSNNFFKENSRGFISSNDFVSITYFIPILGIGDVLKVRNLIRVIAYDEC